MSCPVPRDLLVLKSLGKLFPNVLQQTSFGYFPEWQGALGKLWGRPRSTKLSRQQRTNS